MAQSAPFTSTDKERLDVLAGVRGASGDRAVRLKELTSTTLSIVGNSAGLVSFDQVSGEIPLSQLDAEVLALLAEAEEVRQEAAQLIDDLRAEIDTEFAIEIPRVADVEQAVATIATQVTWLATLAAQTEKNVADAGLYIDPETGKAKIEAVATVEEKINLVTVALDAQAAEISLRATQADVDLAIAAAQLDPAELGIVTGLEGRISDVEIALDAAEAAIDLRATVVDFDALGTDVTEATIRIDALEAQIVQKVETASFTSLESRVTTAEVTLSAIEGSGLAIEVSDIRQDLTLVDGLADMTLEQIANLHQEQLGRLADTALVRQEYNALVTDEREARASLRTELAAAIETNTATILQEFAVVASETEAQATLVTALTATVNANTAAITNESIARATADAAMAGQFSTLSATVEDNTSAIINEQAVRASADSALTAQFNSLTATVNSNTAAINSEAATRANADSALSTQISTVSATANTTAAAVTIQQAAIAELNGNAAASLTLRARAGGATGEIEVVAADDPITGPASAVKIKSDRFQFIGSLAEFLGDVKITGDLIVDGAVSRRVYARGSSITTTTTYQQVVSKTFGSGSFVAFQGASGNRTNPILLNLDMQFTIYSGGSGWQTMDIDAAINVGGTWQSAFLVQDTRIPLDAGFGLWQFSKSFVVDSGSWSTATAMRVRVRKGAAFATRVDCNADYLLTQISV